MGRVVVSDARAREQSLVENAGLARSREVVGTQARAIFGRAHGGLGWTLNPHRIGSAFIDDLDTC